MMSRSSSAVSSRISAMFRESIEGDLSLVRIDIELLVELALPLAQERGRGNNSHTGCGGVVEQLPQQRRPPRLSFPARPRPRSR